MSFAHGLQPEFRFPNGYCYSCRHGELLPSFYKEYVHISHSAHPAGHYTLV